MNDTINFEQFPKICRLCLGRDELSSILKEKFINLFKSITSIEVEQNDQLPQNICKKCCSQLQDISLFIDLCKSNDELLRIIVAKHENCRVIQDDGKYYSDGFDDIKSESSESDTFNEILMLGKVKEEIVGEPEALKLKNDGKTYLCELCDLSFPTNLALSEHYEKSFECRPISYASDHVSNIFDYLNKPNCDRKKTKIKKEEDEPGCVNGKELKGKRKYLCSYCGKNYTRKNGLDRHILSHTGVKNFECKECGKRYITKDTLKTHLLTHTGVKAHKCMVCQKSFTQSSHLGYHMRRHAGDKPHTCMFCGKGFLSTYHLERHKLMHTGLKPYECDQCGKQFVRSTTLRDHLLIHTGEKPFQCQHCGKQFNRKQCLTNHVLVHTGQSKGNGGNIGQNIQLSESNAVATGY